MNRGPLDQGSQIWHPNWVRFALKVPDLSHLGPIWLILDAKFEIPALDRTSGYRQLTLRKICHLNVKKLQKTWHLKKKMPKIFFSFFLMKIFGNFFEKSVKFSQFFGIQMAIFRRVRQTCILRPGHQVLTVSKCRMNTIMRCNVQNYPLRIQYEDIVLTRRDEMCIYILKINKWCMWTSILKFFINHAYTLTACFYA